MKTGIKILGILFCFTIGLLISSCNRSTNITGKISVQLPVYLQTEAGILSSGAPPNSASEIDCFGFLVSNSDTASDRASCKLNSGSTAAYSRSIRFKKAVAGFYSGESAEFEVDAGSNRVIHVIGLKTNMPSGTATTRDACHQMLTSDYNSFSKPFLIASSNPLSVTSGSTQTISLVNGYLPNSTEFFDDCEGPGAPGGGEDNPGPPASAALRLQDNITSVYEYSCVGASLELYDAQGRLTRANENLTFNLALTGGPLMYTGNTFCDVGGSPSGSIGFSNGDFGRKVFFLGFGSITDITLTMAQSVGTSIPIVYPTPTMYSSSHAYSPQQAPLKYSILDVYSFRTTFSSLPANPVRVKAGECRPALLQVVDNIGRPIKAYNGRSGSPGPNNISSTISELNSSALISLSSHLSSCSSTLPTQELLPLNSNPSGFGRFEYFFASGTTNFNFNIKVQRSGLGHFFSTNDINNLDPSSTNSLFNKSFWYSSD